RDAQPAGGGDGLADDLLVAQVDAVEIAKGHRRPAGGRGQALPAVDHVDGHAGSARQPRRRLRGTRITASPSSTGSPSTRHSVFSVTRAEAGSMAATVTRAVTTSPMRTGLWKPRVWPR